MDFVNFLQDQANNQLNTLDNVVNKVTDVGGNLLNIPVGLAGAATNIGNSIASFLGSPLSGITIPLLAVAAIYMFKK